MNDLKAYSNAQLVEACINLERSQKLTKSTLDSYKAELMARGSAAMADRNVKSIQYFGETGDATVQDAYKLDILNPEQLRKACGADLFDAKVKREAVINYKPDGKLETALKAIFLEDYDLDGDLEHLFGIMSILPDEKQRAVLRKKLKGDYMKDRAVLTATLGKTDWDVELFLIHRIRMAELIRAFFPSDTKEELLAKMGQIKKTILVETSTGIKLNYEKEA